MQHTETDLDILIEDELAKCEYKTICLFAQTETGRERIKTRVKEIIFNDGQASIEGALATVEDQLVSEGLQNG